eukprot:10255230-Lingulodinium_polyedra.AAC.1
MPLSPWAISSIRRWNEVPRGRPSAHAPSRCPSSGLALAVGPCRPSRPAARATTWQRAVAEPSPGFF